MLDTEIQTETRDLITFPNTYLIRNPVSATRTSGAIVSVSLSLGYEISHARIQSLLIKAAQLAELEDPFVHILALNDFSVTYRVSGLLSEVKSLLTKRSNLCEYVLDVLHGDGITIVSPTYMNQRQFDKNETCLPPSEVLNRPVSVNAEDIVFDKAELAEKDDKLKTETEEKIMALKEQLKSAENGQKKNIAEILETQKNKLDELKHKNQS